MILDSNLVLSGSVSGNTWTGQTVTGTNTSVLSTNTIDLAPNTIGGNQPSDFGQGESTEVLIETIIAASGGTSVQFQLIEADDAALTVNVQVIVQTDAIAVATLVAGTIVPLHYDRAAPYQARRYIGLRYQLVGIVAAGSYVATIVKNIQDVKNIFYASGFAIK